MRNRRNITVCFFIAVCIFLRVVCETVRLGFKPEFGLKTHYKNGVDIRNIYNDERQFACS